jgi:DNA repair protein RecN (Recombination protein N)
VELLAVSILRSLRIRNLVILSDITLEFGPGLNLLTGETGTGKSIVVDAVGLAVGRRADRSLIRAGSDRAVVEALFEIDAAGPVAAHLAAQQLGDDAGAGEVVIRREISGSGGSIRINGSPATAGMLAELGALLLELHGQHESRGLLLPERHLDLLDRFGGLDEAAAVTERACREVLAGQRAQLELERAGAEREARRRELEQTVRAIEAVAPVPGELAALARERDVLRNGEAVTRLCDELVELCYEGETTASSLGAAAARRARSLAALDPTLGEIAERLAAAAVEIQDCGRSIRDYREHGDFNPARLERVEARRVEIERLLLRHGATEEEALAARDAAAAELAAGLDHDAQLGERRAELARATRDYAAAATELSRLRRDAAAILGPALERQLGALALRQAKVGVRFSPASGEPAADAGLPLHPRGVERAELELAANPGEPARPLHKVASGGELSRVMLALHAVIDGAGGDRVLVFDEVDAGISGRIADAVGARLAELGRRHQVLCVTHLPQVAAYAGRHFLVRKSVEGERTHTAVEPLAREGRIEELGRMLGGRAATAASRRHAAELLQTAGRAAAPQAKESPT